MTTRPTARENILNKLREAVSWPKAESASRPKIGTGDAGDPAALTDIFETKATGAAAVVKRVGGISEATRQIVSFMKEDGLSSAIISDEEIIGKAGIKAALEKAGLRAITISSEPADYKEACFAADAGITGAPYGIAETGSLAMVFDSRNPRLVSHAPFCHIALLMADDILPDTETLVARVTERRVPPSAMALVTGPSMTADIALTAVRGIHGPGKLYIIIIG
ncbi:MAG: lactate utilization protein [Deltaproteobacteria bacterium]|nr:lactate utilization protein [Candidatus Zymogenaceae bacterium]